MGSHVRKLVRRLKKVKVQTLILVERQSRHSGAWLLPSQFRYDSYDIQYEQSDIAERIILAQQLPLLKKLWAEEDRQYCNNGNKPLIAAYL